MKSLVTGAVLALTALLPMAASAQVYGADDDPYSQNPFASNMSLPDTSQTGGSSGTATPQPAQPPAQAQPDTSQTQQQTAASSQGAKAPAQP